MPMDLNLHRVSVLLLMVVLGLSIRAQIPPPQAQIAGRVVRADNGAPIEGAILELWPWGGIAGNTQKAKTDSNGEYYYQGLKARDYMITTSAEEFVNSGYQRDTALDGARISVDNSTRLRGIDIRMTPEAVIRGVVIDVEGRPAGPGVSVAAVRLETRENGSERLMPVSDGLTDEAG